MNYLIVGLGNIGDEYARTRHNIGFRVLDALAGASNLVFEDKRYGFVTTLKVKNQTLTLLKPSTYMNLSGNAVRYWMKEKNVPIERLLVVVDDLALPFGKIRIKPGGSEAGHNGLRHITSVLGTQAYARLRFGIGNEFIMNGRVYHVPKAYQHAEAQRSGLQYPPLGREVRLQPRCAKCPKRFCCSGCTWCSRCGTGSAL